MLKKNSNSQKNFNLNNGLK